MREPCRPNRIESSPATNVNVRLGSVSNTKRLRTFDRTMKRSIVGGVVSSLNGPLVKCVRDRGHDDRDPERPFRNKNPARPDGGNIR